MITITGNTQQARRELDALADGMAQAADEGISDALDALILRLQAVTPVRTGKMRAGYGQSRIGPLHFELHDDQDYARYVVGGTRYMRANTALDAVLGHAEDELSSALDVAITRLIQRHP